MIVTAGKTNVSVYFYLVQDASGISPGEPATGLLFSDIETGGSASFMRQGAARTDLTLITLASVSAAHADGGFILVDDTNMPGVYRCDFPDAAFTSGVDEVSLQVVVAAANNVIAAPLKVQILDVDLRDAVSAGLSRLDAAVTTRLAPTVAARTLDITATGAAGIDWANVENPTTALDLSGTDIQLGSAVTIHTGGIVAASFGVSAIDAAAFATDTINEIADGLLDRDMSTGVDSGSSAVRTARDALRSLRNRVESDTTQVYVYEENDTTIKWTASISTAVSTDPHITGADPNS